MLTRYRQNLHVAGTYVYSYDTHVASIDGDKLIVHGWWSTTTSKHVNYVARELGLTLVPYKPGAIKACPACKGIMSEYPALSRYKDVDICSDCGTREALSGYFWDTSKATNS
jgi:rRNA maturation endonuclease Nob1